MSLLAFKKTAGKCNRRPGVLLLIVLFLLVLILLIATTFIVSASHFQRSARAFSHHERYGGNPHLDLDGALHELLRGPADRSSSVYGHSLLEDLYGSDSLQGTISSVDDDRVSGLVSLGITADTSLSEFPFFYSGAVLTLLDGAARGVSQRVISDTPGRLVVESFGEGTPPRPGDRFLLNGRPFNGTGVGFNPESGALDATVDFGSGGIDHTLPIALLPHWHRGKLWPESQASSGGADETWDAADYQNMFLAAPTDGIPSFHRPALIQYWRTNYPQLWQDPSFRRLVVLRPLPDQHPSFSGSNPAFTGSSLDESLVNGPWDVDNDGDGTPDSVWIDLGWPVQTTRDGRLCKPLFAILCVDLDGRINVNAHGHSQQLNPPLKPPAGIPLAGQPAIDRMNLPTGRGYGPADVALDPIFGGEAAGLLRGEATAVGRYGPDREPGTRHVDEHLSALEHLADHPRWGARSFASASDVLGTTQVALDPSGHPYFFSSTFVTPEQAVVDDPYEVRLMSRSDSQDSLFTLAELERVLRIHDVDSTSLSNRLLQLSRNTVTPTHSTNWRLLTTNSAFIPAPHDLSIGHAPLARAPQRIIQRLAAKLTSQGVPNERLTRELDTLLAPELLRGQRLNLNRPLGNGFDDNGNQVVDEPQESQLGELAWGPDRDDLSVSFQSARFNHTNDDRQIQSPEFSRQIYARHLYCLASWLSDDGTVAESEELERFSRSLAQWVVNLVDFRDPDAVMTAFEYDVNPLDGWQAMDGDPATNEGGQRRLVWGCEYPELIVTETLAWHDRRLRDTDDDSGAKSKRWVQLGEQNVEGDPDLDQYRIPQGSLFVELHCTRSPYQEDSTADRPAELYDNQRRLDLARLAPLGDDDRRHPVWRLLISSQRPESVLRRNSSSSLEPSATDIERIIWFTSQPPPDSPERFITYTNRSAVTTVAAGDFVVIGPRPRRDIDRGKTIVAAAQPPRRWTRISETAPQGIGISVSEPLPERNYYREPTKVGARGLLDAYERPLPDQPFDNVKTRPLARDGLPSFGTVLDYRTVFVQRLANPLQPFHEQRNPYRTIDWTKIDLSIHNSHARAPVGFPYPLSQFDATHPPVEDTLLRFSSRERGKADSNLWSPVIPPPAESVLANRLRFAGRPRHTLGRVNSTMSQPRSSDSDENSPATTTNAWLVWQNGPLTSPYDLMLVPTSPPSRLLYDFNLGAHFGPIGHLPDFFDQANVRIGKLHRLFDFVEVPSRYVGSRQWYDPEVAEDNTKLRFMRPPANWRSAFRDAGRININTLSDPLVWRAIAKGFPPHDSEAFYQKIVRSRQGFGGAPSHRFPTRYANPFRAAASADLMPLREMLPKHAVDATLLRVDPDNRQRRLFTADPTTHPEVLAPHRNQNRNAYFYYQGLQRLGNLLSTQSNVFAVWITVGYFRVESHQADADGPATLRLAEEMNSLDSQARRHRAFYIIDRSIPVGFARGHNHNVQQAVLLRRMID